MENRTTTSFDGVRIAYTTSGAADTALVFVHGGLADRSFWDGQQAALAERFRVIAPDLAGHGESGQNRREWGIAQFGRDVVAVMEAEQVQQAVLIGNSMGGPVAIEAGGRVLMPHDQSMRDFPVERALRRREFLLDLGVPGCKVQSQRRQYPGHDEHDDWHGRGRPLHG